MKELVQMGIDLYNGNITNYSAKESNEAFRKAILDICGVEKIDAKTFRRYKTEIFELVEETLDVLVPQILDGQFDRFADIKNIAWGDAQEFEIPQVGQLFDVAVISYGNGNIARQRLEEGGKLRVSTKMRGVKIYTPFYNFLAGKTDWAKAVNTVAKSFAALLKKEIFDAINASFSSLNSTYGVSATFDWTKLVTLSSHLQAEYGNGVSVFGTKSALAKVTTAMPYALSDAKKDEIFATGYLGSANGIDFIELEQYHKPGTDLFALDDSMLIIVPSGEEKIVKIIFEGEALVSETAEGVNADGSKEYLMEKAYGLAVVPTNKYGIYKMA